MSIIHVRQIEKFLLKEFAEKIDMSDADGYQNKHSHLFLSRALGAYAVHLLAHVAIDDAASCVVDGSNDNGIDAIHIDESNNRLYVVQAKWIASGKGEPDLGSIKKFTDGIVDLINLKFDRFNEKIAQQQSKVMRALEDPSFRMSVVLVHTGVDGPAPHAMRDLNDLIESLNDANEVVELDVIKQTHLHRGLMANVHGEPISIDITMSSWGKKSEPYSAWYGQVSAKQIAEWWNIHHDRLFSKNLRGVLAETDINSEIRNSLLESPELFWYFNNGITLVAEKIEKALAHSGTNEFAALSCTDVSVVNGAQTVGTIGRYSTNPLSNLDQVTVPVRVISIGDSESEFGKRITRSNNRQNRIESRDFVALDEEQIRIQEELAADGLSYQLLRVGEFVPAETAFDVVEVTVALACATADGGLAVQLKREISKLWEDLERAPYKRLFNPSVSGLYVWRCVRTQRLIDTALNELASSKNSLPQLQGVIVHGNRIISALVFSELQSRKFSNPGFGFEKSVSPDAVKQHCVGFANRLSSGIEENYSSVPLPTLFKNAKKCQELIALCQDEDSHALRQMALDFYGG